MKYSILLLVMVLPLQLLAHQFYNYSSGELYYYSGGMFVPTHSHRHANRPPKEKERFMLSSSEGSELLGKLNNCQWVESVHDPYPIGSVPAYEIPACENRGNFKKERMCTGTIKCNYGGSGRQIPLFIENVMCTSNGSECRKAYDCLDDGKVLSAVSIPGKQIEEGKVLSPGRREVER